MARHAIHPGELLAEQAYSQRTRAEFWLNLQKIYELRMAEFKIGGGIER